MRTRLAPLLISIFLLVLAPSLWQQADAAPGDFLFQWGTPHLLSNPAGVAVDSSTGNVFVSEYDKHRIKVFDKNGNLLRSWGSYGSGNGQLNYPTNLALAGNLVYVADSQNNRIEVFDSNGNFVRNWGSSGTGNGHFAHPQGIATDSKGYVYVADTENARVQIFDASGSFIKTLSQPAEYPFNAPWDVTVDGAGNIFVSDGDSIYVFDSAGNFLTHWYIYGYNLRLAVSRNGQLYVTVTDGEDYETDAVVVFDSSGNELWRFGDWGLGDGEFRGFSDIALDADGNVYVAESANNRVQVFDSSGNFLRKIGGTNANGQFYTPTSLATDTAGNVYVADKDNFRIQVFDSAGKFLRKFEGIGWDGIYFAPRLGPLGVATDAAGNVYAATVGGYDDYSGSFDNGKVTVLDSAGNTIREWVLYPEQAVPSALAVDSSGNVFVADVHFHQITVYSNSGIMLRSWGTPGSGNSQFSSPIGVALDGSGNVYVADSGNHRIQVFTRNGAFLRAWGSAGGGDGQFYLPTYLAIDAAGNVYVTDYDEVTAHSRVQVFDANGKFLGKWGSYGSGDGQFIHPTGIAANAAGNVYVADAGNNRIAAFAAVGNGLPASWSGRDIGSVGVAGRASYANGVFTVQGSGANIYGSADAFRFVYQPLNGNGQIIAKVLSVQNTNSYAKAGVMIRQSLTANSTHAMVDITPTSGAEFSRRTVTGGSTTPTARTGIAAPYWVKLVRSGNTFTGSVSSDGTNWTQLSSATIGMTGTVYIGLIVNSHNNAVLCTGTFGSVAVSGSESTAPTVTAFTIPATSSSLTVPITTLTATDDTAVTGYLVNESSTKPSATASGWSATPPASYTFISTGTKTLYAWAKDAAGNVSSSRSATVIISGAALPTPWLTQDIGSVGLAGSASYANGVFTLKGAGADIWGTADAFRFVYKVMSGDGQIVARVASLQNTNTYAKGGVMFRESLAANSKHAMMDVRPSGGAEFSRRTTTGGSTSATTRSGVAAPYWVRLVRSGSTFTGSVSSDGVNWVQVGSASISMGSSVYVGLIVNSHSSSALCTATIDGVK
jgi:tripartite motif-containing protein 71